MTENKPPAAAPSRPRRLGRRRIAASVCTSLAVALVAALGLVALTHTTTRQQVADVATTTNPITPGNFTGFAFDQCQAPKQAAMDMWMDRSPYLGVGIYISGFSRGCRVQTYLNATWVRAQLARGWKLLPITLGPQASCNPKFPRYKDDYRISATPGSNHTFPTARTEGVNEAAKTIRSAQSLGIVPGSTMYYDLEAFDISKYRCRQSALAFLSGWTAGIHRAGYISGVYSSASSGIKMLDNARASKQSGITLPDQIWIADWDGRVNASSSYISSTGWNPHKRIKQFQGGHNETYGGYTINIDRDFVDVGRGLVAPTVTHCGGVGLDLPSYPVFRLSSAKSNKWRVRAIKCMLRQQGLFPTGTMDGQYGPHIQAAVHRWKSAHHWRVSDVWYREDWISLFAAGQSRVLKFGSGNESVRYVQRALNAADPTLHLPITGLFGSDTRAALKAYQKRVGAQANGIVAPWTWRTLAAGKV